MILLGLDDTDTIDSPGTNQLAKAIVRSVGSDWKCRRIVRHQLLSDPAIPFTSKNGSASITLEPRPGADPDFLFRQCLGIMRAWFVEGSDPGLCLAANVPEPVLRFGQLCQQEIQSQSIARQLAKNHDIQLIGLGGTEGGVIGALAAVGLAASGNDGRVVQHEEFSDDLSGIVSSQVLEARGILVLEEGRLDQVTGAMVDIGKKLRPNRRDQKTVLFVTRTENEGPAEFRALKRL